MKKSSSAVHFYLPLSIALLMLALLVTCGGGGSGTTGVVPPTTASVTTTISDQPTCLTPNGPFQNVWVTITRVRANTSSTAGPNDSGWVDLVNLQTNPVQIDLLSLPSPTCLLTQLGIASTTPPGKYQQVRLFLLSNTPGSGEALPASNNCDGNGFNCVVMAGGAIQTILISSEAQTGVQIPPGQIAGGSFTVTAGQSFNLNIDFDACSSVIQQGNGQFRLKPVIHAGLISLNNNFISGTVVNNVTRGAIPNATVFVEQPDPSNLSIDRIISQTTTGAAGDFIICPLPSGSYDVVVATKDSRTNTTYNATVTLQVPVGTAVGQIPMVPQTGVVPGTINGQITTDNPIGLPTSANLSLSALQQAGSLLATIPPLPTSTPTNLPSENGIANYTLLLPAGNPLVGTFSASPPTFYTPSVPAPGIYFLNAQAFTPMSSNLNPGSPDCTPSSLPTAFSGTSLTVVTGGTVTQDFIFTGCQ